MFLPCRPCCAAADVCLDGCPSKTNTLRLSVTASDYDWLTDAYYRSGASPPPATTPTKMAYHFPGSIFNGTFDLTSSDGQNYYYYFTPCVYQSFLYAFISGSTCLLRFYMFSVMHVDPASSGASCSTYTWVIRNFYNSLFAATIDCNGSLGVFAGSSLSFPAGAVSPVQTIASAHADWVSSSTASRIYRALSSTTGSPQGLFGLSHAGLIYEPYGTPTVSGSDSVEVTSATFV